MIFSAGFWYFLSVIFCLIIHEIGHTIVIKRFRKKGHNIFKSWGFVGYRGNIGRSNELKLYLSGVIPSVICMYFF